MAKPQLATNPLYPLLVIVGLCFALTACADGVLMVNLIQPDRAATIHDDQAGLLGWLNRNGNYLLAAELALLTLFTFAAIGTDGYWSRGEPAAADSPASKSTADTPA